MLDALRLGGMPGAAHVRLQRVPPLQELLHRPRYVRGHALQCESIGRARVSVMERAAAVTGRAAANVR